jgi:hypothetical protein
MTPASSRHEWDGVASRKSVYQDKSRRFRAG